MIVVGGLDLGEADRIVRFLSADQGRSAAVVRNARSSRKRFAGRLDPGTRLGVSLRKGKGSLPVVTELDQVAAPDKARRDLDRLTLLMYGCEVCAALAPEHHPAPRLTRLLEVWLDLLEGELTPGHAARQALEGKALTFAGLTPALTVCAGCGGAVGQGGQLDWEAGGVVHAHCGTGRAVAADALLPLERLRRTALAEVVDNRLAAGTGEVVWLLSDFIAWQLGRPLRTRALLEEVLGEAGEQR